MPYTRPFVQVTAEGVFGLSATAPIDLWRAGWKMAVASGGTVSPSAITAFLTAIAPAVSTYHASAATAAGSSAKLVSLSGAFIGQDGRYVDGAAQPTTRFTYGTPVDGASGTVLPYSTAQCITLRTTFLRGPASKGRIFWPATSATITSNTGARTTAQQTASATAAKTMCDAINVAGQAQLGGGSVMIVASKVGNGTQSPVIRVDIGARLDAQERRENAIKEAYLGANLAVSTALLDERDRELRERFEDYLEDLERTP